MFSQSDILHREFRHRRFTKLVDKPRRAILSQTVYETTFCSPGVWGMILPGVVSCIFLTFPSVTVLALERYMSIAHSLWHQFTVTSRRCYTWIAVVWLVNFIYAGITVISVAQDKSSLSIVLYILYIQGYFTSLQFLCIFWRSFQFASSAICSLPM